MELRAELSSRASRLNNILVALHRRIPNLSREPKRCLCS